MVDEMTALHDNGTWEMIPLPFGKSVVGCRWVFIVKYLSDGTFERYGACLVVKGYTQTLGVETFYGVDYARPFL